MGQEQDQSEHLQQKSKQENISWEEPCRVLGGEAQAARKLDKNWWHLGTLLHVGSWETLVRVW